MTQPIDIPELRADAERTAEAMASPFAVDLDGFLDRIEAESRHGRLSCESSDDHLADMKAALAKAEEARALGYPGIMKANLLLAKYSLTAAIAALPQ